MPKQNPAAANMDIHGYSLLQSPALASARKRADGLVYAYMFSYPNFHTYWLRLQTKALAPCLRTNSGNCWTLLEDYQNTIMYLRLTHTSSFYQGGSMPPIQTSQLCEDSLQAPVYHKHWPLSRSNDDLHILRDGTKQQAAARSITFPIQVTRESSAGGGKAQMHKGASTRHGSQWALQWLG